MQGKRMSDIKKVFLAGKEAYDNPKFVYKPKPYDGPLEETITSEEVEYFKRWTEREPVVLNTDWDKNLKATK